MNADPSHRVTPPVLQPTIVSDPSHESVVAMLDQLAGWLDSKMRLPVVGWRFGWDAILGLIPGVGDAVSALLGLMLLSIGARTGVPRITMVRMTLNTLIDFAVGAIPILGDLFDIAWKSNSKNVALLRANLSGPRPRVSRLGDWTFVVGAGLVMFAVMAGCLWLGWFLISAVVDALAG